MFTFDIDEEPGTRSVSELSQPVDIDDIRAEAAARLFIPLRAAHKEIRLLALHPGEKYEPLSCSLLYTSLLDDSPLPYETVSYCWGDIKDRSFIRVEGDPLDIPASSGEVLRRLRRVNSSRILWIDAVCINQNNLEEKGRQVAFMGEVYRKAQHNIIWLGEEDGNTASALQEIQLILEDARIGTENFRTLPQTAYDQYGAYVISTTGLNTSFHAELLLDFFDRPWFHRLWVVQEATLAKFSTCLCGSFKIALTDILRTAQWLFYKQRFLNFPIFSSRGIVNAARVWEFADHEFGWLHSTESRPTEFRPLLHALRDFDTLDPKDHVFGVLGLYQILVGTSTLPRALIPDYNRSATEVLESATIFAIEERGDLDVLSSLLHWPEESDYGFSLASWVPRWHRPVENDKDAMRLAFFFRADNGVGLSREPLFVPEYPRCLILRGFVVDEVSRITHVLAPRDFDGDDRLAEVIKEIGTVFDIRPFDSSLSNSVRFDFASVLIAGRNSKRQSFTEQDLPDYEAFVIQLGAVAHEQPLASFDPNTEVQTKRAARFLQAFRDASNDRRFFATKSGLSGVGPSTMSTGDHVCIMYGGRWPVILRKDDKEYRMRGISYVHGIMHGEAARDRKFREESFCVI